VRSYFNDPGVALLNSFSTNRSTSSSSYVELKSEIRIEFLVWSGEIIQLFSSGQADTGANGTNYTSIGIDGAVAEDVFAAGGIGGTAGGVNAGVPLVKSGLSEGYHYATLVGKVNSGTGLWEGSNTPGTRCTLAGYAKLN